MREWEKLLKMYKLPLARDWMSRKIATCEEHMQEGEESG